MVTRRFFGILVYQSVFALYKFQIFEGLQMPALDTLTSAVLDSIGRTPGANAIRFKGQRYDWGAIAALRAELAASLPTLAQGAVVGLLPRNRPATLASFFAIIANGWTVSIINPYQSPESVASDITALQLPAVIADPEDWSDAALGAAFTTGSLALEAIADSALRIAVKAGNADKPAEPYASAPDVAVFMITSGTTGAPKRVPLMRRTLHLSIEEVRRMSAAMGDQVKDRASPDLAVPLIQHVSLAHLAGITSAMQMAVEHRPLVLMEKFTVQDWERSIVEVRPSMTGLTPTMMRMILAENVPPESLNSLTAVRSGTAPLDDATQRAWEQRYGIPVLGNYGATEYCGPIASWSLDDHATFGTAKRGSVGRLNTKEAVVRVLDPDTHKHLPDGETGLLQVQVHRVGDGWITTNDLGRVDADGFVYLEGRADDAINRGGFKIVPEFVADILRTHPEVLDVAIIGIPDVRLGQVPIAFVEKIHGAKAPGEQEMVTFARANLVAYQVPTRIIIVDALPRTPSGKVARPGLRKLIEDGILDRTSMS